MLKNGIETQTAFNIALLFLREHVCLLGMMVTKVLVATPSYRFIQCDGRTMAFLHLLLPGTSTVYELTLTSNCHTEGIPVLYSIFSMQNCMTNDSYMRNVTRISIL